MNVYLIRADYEPRSVRLGLTARLCMISMLPDDEAFLQIRAKTSQDQSAWKQKAERCTLTAIGNTMKFKAVPCGDLHRGFTGQSQGHGVRPDTEVPGQSAFLTLEPSGLLVRKLL